MPCGSLLTSGQIGANGVVDVSGGQGQTCARNLAIQKARIWVIIKMESVLRE